MKKIEPVILGGVLVLVVLLCIGTHLNRTPSDDSEAIRLPPRSADLEPTLPPAEELADRLIKPDFSDVEALKILHGVIQKSVIGMRDEKFDVVEEACDYITAFTIALGGWQSRETSETVGEPTSSTKKILAYIYTRHAFEYSPCKVWDEIIVLTGEADDSPFLETETIKFLRIMKSGIYTH